MTSNARLSSVKLLDNSTKKDILASLVKNGIFYVKKNLHRLMDTLHKYFGDTYRERYIRHMYSYLVKDLTRCSSVKVFNDMKFRQITRKMFEAKDETGKLKYVTKYGTRNVRLFFHDNGHLPVYNGISKLKRFRSKLIKLKVFSKRDLKIGYITKKYAKQGYITKQKSETPTSSPRKQILTPTTNRSCRADVSQRNKKFNRQRHSQKKWDDFVREMEQRLKDCYADCNRCEMFLLLSKTTSR